MAKEIPPSAEVIREQARRALQRITNSINTFVPAMERVTTVFQQLTVMLSETEMMFAADTMRDCPRETDNRLVDWLR